MQGMEFNINANAAGARLRTGVGQHTLSIGDRDVTLMINGTRDALTHFAASVCAEVGFAVTQEVSLDDLIGRVADKAAETDQVIHDVEVRMTRLTPNGRAEWVARLSPPIHGTPFKHHGGFTMREAVVSLAKAVGL